jgi:hypothetical protein
MAIHTQSGLDGHAGEAALVCDSGADQIQLLLDTTGDGHADLTLLIDGHHIDFTHFRL